MTTKQMTLGQFDKLFPDEEACWQYLYEKRWGAKGVSCPRCGNQEVYELTKEWHWQCQKCSAKGYRFSLLVGTIFENTNYPLRTWFKVMLLMLTSKKGISALQIHRLIGTGSYRTAWYMCNRIRAGLSDPSFRKLTGFVEIDETYVGGKRANKHKDKRGSGPGASGPKGPAGPSGKAIVIGAVKRKGRVVARVIENITTEQAMEFIRETVSSKVSLISTDQLRAYERLGREFPHGIVNHDRGEYVMGSIHTQTIEGFWSLIKRGIMGTFHKVSKKYLPLYVAEFEFRYNNRKNPDIFGAAIALL